jgi:hypothetical protein
MDTVERSAIANEKARDDDVETGRKRNFEAAMTGMFFSEDGACSTRCSN